MTQQNELNSWELESYVIKNQDYFRLKWKRHISNKFFKGWNWVCLFFPVSWFAYRKLYKEIVIYIVLIIGITIGLESINLGSELITDTVCDSLRVFAAIFANALYRNKVINVVQKTRSLEMEDAKVKLTKMGGTSIVALIISILIQVGGFITIQLLLQIT